jgi:hypothetical protein
LAFTAPHAEHVFELGNHRLATTTRAPASAALYSVWRRNSPIPNPERCRARLTWFDDEMQTLCDTAAQLGMPVAVHTGAAEGCKQAIRCGARSLEHAYLIDVEAIAMAEQAGVFLVPTMQMTREDLHELADGTLAPTPRPNSVVTPTRSAVAELLDRDDIGVLEPGRAADIIAMPGDPITDISLTTEVDFVMRTGHIHRAAPDTPAETSG